MRTELVTTLKRKATQIIAALDAEEEPVLITQHGRPAAFLMHVDAYVEMEERIKLLEGIARGERAVQEGRVLTHEEAKRRLARWLD